MSAGLNEISRQSMKDYGFDFKYFTNIDNDGKGVNWYCCYDVGYIVLDEDNLQLGKMKKL